MRCTGSNARKDYEQVLLLLQLFQYGHECQNCVFAKQWPLQALQAAASDNTRPSAQPRTTAAPQHVAAAYRRCPLPRPPFYQIPLIGSRLLPCPRCHCSLYSCSWVLQHVRCCCCCQPAAAMHVSGCAAVALLRIGAGTLKAGSAAAASDGY